jgi:hypothetical protein
MKVYIVTSCYCEEESSYIEGVFTDEEVAKALVGELKKDETVRAMYSTYEVDQSPKLGLVNKPCHEAYVNASNGEVTCVSKYITWCFLRDDIKFEVYEDDAEIHVISTISPEHAQQVATEIYLKNSTKAKDNGEVG